MYIWLVGVMGWRRIIVVWVLICDIDWWFCDVLFDRLGGDVVRGERNFECYFVW